MKIEDLKNTKIYLSNKEDRVKFQEKVFKLGVKWRDGTIEIGYVEDEFYYIDGDLKMTMDGGFFSLNWFLRKRKRQVFLDEVLAIEEPKEECEFKPFDRVLVRDGNDGRWKPGIFSWHNVDYDKDHPFPFETADGCFYSHCIPYKGNEELTNTTKNPEQ